MGQRAAAVRHDPVLELGVRQRDRLGPLREQVDDRRAAEPERVGRDVPRQVGDRPVQVEVDLQLVARVGQRPTAEAGQVDEQELLGEREVLGQQPVAQERAGRVGEQPLVALEADLAAGSPRPSTSGSTGRSPSRPAATPIVLLKSSS